MPTIDETTNLGKYGLVEAEEDGSLQPIGSVLDINDQRIKDYIFGSRDQYPRIVTFNRLLKSSSSSYSSSSSSSSSLYTSTGTSTTKNVISTQSNKTGIT